MQQAGPQRVALVVHTARPEARALGERARVWWAARGFEVAVLSAFVGSPPAELPDGGVRFAISLGGDGTLLRTVELVSEQNVPVLGVNLGHLGYLTQVEPDQMEAAFDKLVAGSFTLEERMTIEVLAGPAALLEEATAGDLPGMPCLVEPPLHRLVGLNEASLEKTAPGHTIRFSLEIDGKPFLTYAADGVLVATPTGSTAFNLSLRGPILSPRLRALVVTPISPHMLFDRSLVLDGTQSVRVELLDGRPGLLVVDGGTVVPLDAGDAVLVRAGPSPVPIVRFASRNFLDVLRLKFDLTDR